MNGIKMWWKCVCGIDLQFAWRLTLEHAFPHGNVFELLLSPITVPIFYCLFCYQSYNINKIIALLERTIGMFSTLDEGK